MNSATAPPVLVTGLPRSGTSWVGKMLELSGQFVYVNEPMNPRHPPGRSPGVLDAEVTHRFQYVCPDNDAPWRRAFGHTLGLRYQTVAELRRNHSPYDLGRMAKYWSAFTVGRAKGRRALLDDPFALFSSLWLSQQLDVSVVVLMRDPASLVGSWRRLGWTFRPHELLEQPLLMRDHLGPHEATLRSLVGEQDDLVKIAGLWSAAYDAVDRFRQADPRIQVIRYEELAGEPVRRFGALYSSLGLPFEGDVRAQVEAATTTTVKDNKSHHWSVRGGLSRTAFKPMDSRAQLAAAQQRLAAGDVARVRELTAATMAKFGPVSTPVTGPVSTPAP